jgi:exosome complex component RRP42
MVRLSNAELKFVEFGVQQNIRNDGRARFDHRPISIETCEEVPQAYGSGRVTLCKEMEGMNGLTDVMVVIKGEVVTPDSDHPNEGFIEASVNCSSSLYADVSDRRSKVEEVTSELTCALTRMAKSFPLESLCVMKGRFCWRLFIDVLVITDDGNLLDVSTHAMWIALNKTKLPRLKAVAAQAGFKDDFFLDSNPTPSVSLSVEALPVIVTFSRIGNKFILDATSHEEKCRSGQVSIAVNSVGNICGVFQDGTVTCSQVELMNLMNQAHATSLGVFSGLVEGTSNKRQKVDKSSVRTE